MHSCHILNGTRWLFSPFIKSCHYKWIVVLTTDKQVVSLIQPNIWIPPIIVGRSEYCTYFSERLGPMITYATCSVNSDVFKMYIRSAVSCNGVCFIYFLLLCSWELIPLAPETYAPHSVRGKCYSLCVSKVPEVPGEYDVPSLSPSTASLSTLNMGLKFWHNFLLLWLWSLTLHTPECKSKAGKQKSFDNKDVRVQCFHREFGNLPTEVYDAQNHCPWLSLIWGHLPQCAVFCDIGAHVWRQLWLTDIFHIFYGC